MLQLGSACLCVLRQRSLSYEPAGNEKVTGNDKTQIEKIHERHKSEIHELQVQHTHSAFAYAHKNRFEDRCFPCTWEFLLSVSGC
jgi:hypothetical protein